MWPFVEDTSWLLVSPFFRLFMYAISFHIYGCEDEYDIMNDLLQVDDDQMLSYVLYYY